MKPDTTLPITEKWTELGEKCIMMEKLLLDMEQDMLDMGLLTCEILEKAAVE